MAFICELFAGDKSMQLGYEQAIRALPFGSNWTTLRLSVLFSINGVGSLAGGKGLSYGVCTGAKAVLDTDCIDAYYTGSFVSDTSSTTTFYDPGFYQGNSGNSVGAIQKVGTSTQMGNSLVYNYQRVSAMPYAYRTLNMFTITKGANGLMSFTGHYFNSSLVDTSRATYLSAIESTSTPSGMTVASQSYTPTLRMARDWNAAFVAWNMSIPSVNIYAWSVTRFA